MEPLLSVSNLCVEFWPAEGLGPIRALNGANLRVAPGEVLGVLGESGSGKSTLAKAVMRLLPSTSTMRGVVSFAGRNLLTLTPRELQRVRGARVSLIPQEPGLALNPFLKVGAQIAEILRVHKGWDWKRCRAEAESLLDFVQRSQPGRKMFDAYPHQLSGGQKQRVVIAQALSCAPDLIIADEPTASLDHATQAGVLALLHTLRELRHTALLLITHDPRILEGFANRIAVMYAGRVIEDGPANSVLDGPRHPYTRALLACARRHAAGEKLALGQRLPSIPGTAPDLRLQWRGCSFLPRCSERMPQCEEQPPAAAKRGDSLVECFLES
jgi:oligopeptide/dipeptide ABC transporter ATP-binding protein